MRHRVRFLLLLLCCGCHSSEPPTQPPASLEQAVPVPPSDTAPVEARRHEALPRAVAGITLGMNVTDAERALGHLECHDTKGGVRVCRGEKRDVDEAHALQLYIAHDRVISVSYESPPPANVWDALNGLIDRFGRPSLSGVRERDTNGRVHEIYGWKDEESLYSVRFMWKERDTGSPELMGTAVALWDRKGYQQWEAETQPPAAPEQPREPT